MTRRRYREQREPKACLVPGCRTCIEPWKSICDEHYRALPWATRNAIREARENRASHMVADLMSKGAAALAVAERQRGAASAARNAAMLGERND